MRLFGRTKSPQPGAVINGEYIPNAVQPSRGRNWLRILWRVLVVILIVVLLYLTYLFLKDVFGNNKSKPVGKPGIPGQVNAPGESSTTNGSNIQVSNGGSSNPELTNNSTSGNKSTGSNKNPAPTTASPQSGNSGNNQNLTNSGPGDVAKVFAITTAAGAVAYQVVIRRKITAAE